MKMEKTLQTLRYLAKSFSGVIVIGFFVILGTVAVTDLIWQLTSSSYNSVQQVVPLTVPFEVAAGIFALLTGLLLFIMNFKVALVNGISRKTFLLANLPAAVIVAAVFSIFDLVVVKVHGLFWPVISIMDLFYPHAGWAGILILQFTLYFLLIMAGRFIALAYYRSNTAMKWVISLSPFILYGLLKVADASSGGRILAALREYRHTSMSMEWAPFTMLAYAVIMFGLVYLLIRRAPLKD
jgi:hypothetical protein